jgi:predicted amidohydrolase
MKGRIALVQFRSSTSDETNIERMEGFIKKEKGKSDLIVFPELSIKRTFSEVEEGVFLEVLGDIAKDNKIDIVPGSILVRTGAKTYNRSYYIDRNGKVIAKYDKTNLWKSEKLSKGSGPKAFKTRFGRTSLIICWDLASPNVASKLSKLKLDLIICPSMWWQGTESGAKTNFTQDMIDALCLARTYESRAVVAFTNTAGKLKLRRFTDWTAGRSQITAPFKNRICESKGSKEEVIRCTFNFTSLYLTRRYFGS